MAYTTAVLPYMAITTATYGLFSWTTWVSWPQKGKSIVDFNEARWGWWWQQLDLDP